LITQYSQARNQLGTPGGEEFSESGPHISNQYQCLRTMSSIFIQGGLKCFWGGLPPALSLVMGLNTAQELQKA